jgi:hypothetical protein
MRNSRNSVGRPLEGGPFNPSAGDGIGHWRSFAIASRRPLGRLAAKGSERGVDVFQALGKDGLAHFRAVFLGEAQLLGGVEFSGDYLHDKCYSRSRFRPA